MGARLFKLMKSALRPRPLLSLACGMALGWTLWLILPPRLLSVLECYHPWPALLSPDGERLALPRWIGQECHIDIGDSSTGVLRRYVFSGPWLPTCLVFTPDSRAILVGGWHSISLLETEAGSQVDLLRSKEPVFGLMDRLYFDENGRLYAYDLTGRRVWDPISGQTLWQGGEGQARALPGLPGFVVRQEADSVTVLEMPSGRVRGTFKVPQQHDFEPSGISRDGRRLFGRHGLAWGVPHFVLVDVESGTVKEIPWLNDTRVSAFMSPDGRYLAVLEAGEPSRPAWVAWLLPRPDASVRCRLVDIDSGREIAQLPGGRNLVFSDDSSRIAIVDDQNPTIRIWDLRTGWVRIVANAAIAALFVYLLLGWLQPQSRRQPATARAASASAGALS
jgi:hypothetical protein